MVINRFADYDHKHKGRGTEKGSLQTNIASICTQCQPKKVVFFFFACVPVGVVADGQLVGHPLGSDHGRKHVVDVGEPVFGGHGFRHVRIVQTAHVLQALSASGPGTK